MTLMQLIQTIESVVQKQPNIKMIVRNDVFRINSAPSLQYGVFAWTQGQHSGTTEGQTSFSFSFFYVDRLKGDASNQIEVQSVACATLTNILRSLEERDIEIGSYTLQTFNQRFTDECAGAFCNVTLSVMPSFGCAEVYSDYSKDFSDDFVIY